MAFGACIEAIFERYLIFWVNERLKGVKKWNI
jgi:hypothetical protein